MVECFLPRGRSTELAEVALRLSAAAGSGASAADSARYLRSAYVPEDEICFHIFEAETVEAVREASLKAFVAFDRILEAEECRP